MKTPIAILFMALLFGCTTIGQKFDPALANALQPGASSIADAIAVLGTPAAESYSANGSRLLQWQYAQGTPFGGSGAHLAILFDADGSMIRVIHKHQTSIRN